MAKAIAIFTGGITELRQLAVRADGVCFSRLQGRDPRYGYSWSKWKRTGERLGANAVSGLDEMQVGFASLRRAHPDSCNLNDAALFNAKGEIRVRVP